MTDPIILTDDERAELRELCADPATTAADVLAWYRERGHQCSEDYARITLQGQRDLAERRQRKREQHTRATVAQRVRDLEERAAELVGQARQPVTSYLVRCLQLQVADAAAREDLQVHDVHRLAETVALLADLEARLVAEPSSEPRQIVIPPGTVELISAQVYGLRR